MVIVKLFGGIGNQMFQYATGKRLALVRGSELKLDISWYQGQDKRSYALRAFDIVEKFASNEEIRVLTSVHHGLIERLRARILKVPLRTSSKHYMEQGFGFNSEVLDLPGDTYLVGYWQDERYFLDVEENIRAGFTVKTNQDSTNRELSEIISSRNSVSLHIRRGDFISEREIRDIHGSCDLDYYLRASEIISKKLSEPHFFVFSDDPDWVKGNFEIPYPMILVDHNKPEKDFEDLRLLSQCRHHIIANSSFSWWGAWLCENQEKIVVAPARWFNAPVMEHENPSPSSWIRI